MQCTDCHQTVRPVVALDIDGTLGDYYSHFTNFVNEYYDKSLDPEEYTGSMPFKDWFLFHSVSESMYRQAKLAYRQGGQKRTMPVYAWSQPLVRLLRQSLGVELWIATARPYLRLDNIDPDTREWLSRNNMQYDGLLYGHDKYERLMETVGAERIVCVVDDQTDMIDGALKQGLQAIQIVNGHNRYGLSQHTGCEHVLGWDLQSHIAQKVAEWHKRLKTPERVT